MAYTKFLTVAGVAALFAACGGDFSSGADDPGKVTESAENSSSSKKNSSSSGKAKSSSSAEDENPTSSADGKKDSSSSGSIGSSSSGKGSEPVEGTSSSSVSPTSSSSISGSAQTPSSSSVVQSSSSVASSSSSAGEVNCSALLEDETGWNWNVPKECRLNPEISYGTMTDSRDGKKYKTVTIGDQVWMAENLNYADSAKTPSLKGKSWCYDNEAKNCDIAGRLYTWAAAIDSVKLANDADNPQDCGYGRECGLTGKVQGICPSGWHLPSYDEWNALFTAVGGQSNEGKVLKSQTGWYSNGNGTDAFGFSALPAGYRYYDGDFNLGGGYALFWSATEYDSNGAYYMYLYYGNEGAGLNYSTKDDGFSVRCLKD